MTAADLRSTGFRTDLRVLELGGSEIDDRGTHLVVRTPDNPSYHWGNFLLLRSLPVPGGEREVVGAFHTEFPEARHVSIGLDGTEDPGAALEPFVEAGLAVDPGVVLTATSLAAPQHPVEGVEVRPLEVDDDWEQRVQLDLVVDDVTPDDDVLAFVRARVAGWRRLAEAGHARWYGAFEEGRLLSSCGVVRTAPAEARFQSVATHPHARRRGLAAAVVHRAGTDALADASPTGAGDPVLVIVADPGGPAERIYRSLGFSGDERQVQLYRTP